MLTPERGDLLETPSMNSKMIPVAVINPDAPPESLEAKQPDVDNGAEIYD